DPLVVHLHALLREVVLASETPREFVEAFKPDRFSRTLELVAPLIPAGERDAMLRLLHEKQGELYADYARRVAPEPKRKTSRWPPKGGPSRYVRLLYRQGRIQSVKGNLLTAVSLPAISRSARKLGVPLRVFYSSNADDIWELKERYRESLLG